MVSKLHNQKIYINDSNYENILSKSITTRSAYLNYDNKKIISNKIKGKQDMLFLSNDVNESLIFHDYQLISHGILPCGSKATVIINKIYPYVDIEYDITKTDEENLNWLKSMFKHESILKMLKGKSIDCKSVKIIEGKKFMLYNKNKIKFIRISFVKLYHRICLIRFFNKLKIVSFNNDLSNYYRVVSRTYNIFLSSWNKISNYVISRNTKYKSEYVLTVDLKDIVAYDDTKHEIEFPDIDIDLIRKDNTISMAFDIEQYSSNFNPLRPDICILPSGKIKEDEVFNIGMTYQFINEKSSFLNIALLTKEANEHEDYVTIICKNERTLLKAFGYINKLMQPDYIMEFNGSEFDWINLYDKFLYYNILEEICQNLSIRELSSYELRLENIAKYYYSIDSVKISADVPSKATRNLNLEGYIPFDVRVIFMQLNPTNQKSSLKFYLEMNNMAGKDDMPIPELFRIYKDSDVSGMTDVAHYCYIDSFRLHELVFKNNIIQDKREVCKLSYTSTFDGFYRANGCKVRNLIISEAIQKDLFINTIKLEDSNVEKMDGKYPGALVLHPKKGLVNNVLNIQEFCNEKLNIYDEELIKKLQTVINNNYEKIYINKNISNVNY